MSADEHRPSAAERHHCEMMRLTKTWTRSRCKRNATTYAAGKHLCEQHAKIILGLPEAISGVPAVLRVKP